VKNISQLQKVVTAKYQIHRPVFLNATMIMTMMTNLTHVFLAKETIKNVYDCQKMLSGIQLPELHKIEIL
jgi:hypothetical protein